MLLIEWVGLAPGLVLTPPDFFAVEVPAAHLAAGVEEPDVLAVGDGGGRGGIAVGVHHGAGNAAFEADGPENFACLGVDGVAENCGAGFGRAGLVGFEGGEEETVAPDGDAALAAVG